jgi:hypothetical protein
MIDLTIRQDNIKFALQNLPVIDMNPSVILEDAEEAQV